MAEHSKFFDSLNPLEPDKEYTAEEFVGYFGKLITDGVMKGEANMLKVETSGSNMNTIVNTGTAFLKAREYENDSKLSLTHEVEALGKSRIDRVVIRLMLNVDYREAKAFVKKGVAGLAPVVPQLERTDEVYEISLAQVKVIGGQTYINVADVVDERGKVDICPWAGSKILPNFDDTYLGQLIGDVDNLTTNAVVKSEKGVANGVASLGANGLVNPNQLSKVTYCIMGLSSAQSIPNGSFATVIFNSVIENNDIMAVSGGTSHSMVCNTAGLYLITLNIQFETISTGGNRSINIQVNNSQVALFSTSMGDTSISAAFNTERIIRLKKGDTIKGVVFHTNGNAISVGGLTNLSAVKIAD